MGLKSSLLITANLSSRFNLSTLSVETYNLCRKTRYSSNPFSLIFLPFLPIFRPAKFSSLPPKLLKSENKLSANSNFRTFNQNPNSRIANRSTDEFREIVKLIERGENDMESKLNRMNVEVSCGLVSSVLGSANSQGDSALKFFNWAKTQPGFCPNVGIYNQIINFLGRLGDFESMLVLLDELSTKGCCLTERAFDFLSRSRSVRDSVKKVAETLISVGGSIRSSGIHSLITKLAALDFFDLAVLVMEETARKTSYYNVLIGTKCRNGKFQEAKDLLKEMKRIGCDPNTKSYNYLLGSLCKNGEIGEACDLLEKMEDSGYYPDQITFEVIAYHACRLGRIDSALEFLNRMMGQGLEPRLTTHSAFIKGYFCCGRIQDAYRFVVGMNEKDKYSANMNYSLLASLFLKSGKVFEARSILVEMIDKELKPNFPIFIKVVKELYYAGRKDLAGDLKLRFSKFKTPSNIEAG